MATNTNPSNSNNEGKDSIGKVGPWHLAIALIGVGSIIYLAGFVFKDLFTTSGDVLSVISYIAAVLAAVFGIQIAVKGAQASAENQNNKETAQSISKEFEPLELEIADLMKKIRTIGESPSGNSLYLLGSINKANKQKQVEIAPEKIENISIRLARIKTGINQISK
jgi:hypothetical protein